MTLSYTQQAAAAISPAFIAVVSQAMLKVAQDIASEATNTPGHAARYLLAQKVLNSPGAYVTIFPAGVVADGVTDGTAADTAIYNRLSAIWNGYAGA